jgi:carbon starvation protein
VLVSFLLTSTDTAVRLGRYMVEELVGTPETQVQEVAANRYVNAFLQVAPAYVLVASGRWADLWPLFGGANQTLAALALLVSTVWLANWDDRKQLISTGVPMAFMLVITTLALLYLALYQNLYQKFVLDNWANGGTLIEMASAGVQIVIALVLIWLALSLAYMGITNIRKARGTGTAVADGGDPDDD